MWTVNKNICFTSFNSNFYEAIYSLFGVYPEINKDLIMKNKRKILFLLMFFIGFIALSYAGDPPPIDPTPDMILPLIRNVHNLTYSLILTHKVINYYKDSQQPSIPK